MNMNSIWLNWQSVFKNEIKSSIKTQKFIKFKFIMSNIPLLCQKSPPFIEKSFILCRTSPLLSINLPINSSKLVYIQLSFTYYPFFWNWCVFNFRIVVHSISKLANYQLPFSVEANFKIDNAKLLLKKLPILLKSCWILSKEVGECSFRKIFDVILLNSYLFSKNSQNEHPSTSLERSLLS